MKTTLLPALICLSVMSCDPKNPPATAEAIPAPQPPRPKPALPELTGHGWQVDEIRGNPLVVGSGVVLRFNSAEKVSGHGGVNRFGGSCTIEDDKLTFGAMISTQMAGASPLMKQERALLDALDEVRKFRAGSDARPELLGEGGEAIVRLSPEKKP